MHLSIVTIPLVTVLFGTFTSAAVPPHARSLKHVAPPAVVRQEPTPTGCTTTAVATLDTINRGNEGIWHVKPNQTGWDRLYRFEQQGWMDNDKQAVLNKCTEICLAGNNTEEYGQWLPSGKYFQGAFVNTPGGTWDNPRWRCECWNRAISQADLASGGGVDGNLNPGSGTIMNRDCE